MLRELQSLHLAPQLFALKARYTGGVPAMTMGINDVSSVDDVGTGDVRINLKNKFVANSSVTTQYAAAAAVAPVLAAGNAVNNIRSEATISKIRLGDATTDVDFDVIYAGWQAVNSTDLTIPNSVRCNLVAPRMIVMRISTTTPTVSAGASQVQSITKNGTGDVTVVLKTAFGAVPCIVYGNETATTRRLTTIPANTNAGQFRVTATNTGGTAVEATFTVILLGGDSTDITGGNQNIVDIQGRMPRLISFGVDQAAGANIIYFGSKDGTFSDDGTGIYTFTFSKAFARTPFWAGSANTPGITATAISSTAISIRTDNSGGSAADSQSSIVIIGFDEASEY